ncbi:DNA mismatch repair endonuclease MutL [Halorhabdus amylolytica]|uniref:DNA mismatch repair endonuclease MutL n=1 Tax=Halorhabdus amylolytica TaxID=2559573 RepID=UPI0010A9BFAC|nr:DNA mismatch repair endonuclease MutL [Halorhabdus amylolytica]
MTEIKELDGATVERIAAGEVVERPASVVKELLENSLDADASRARVAIEAGGTDGIRVSDDGVGMTESQVRTAVREHTTSKISDIDDLESGVPTLGFRGEALHAIGAVSRLTITTRPRGGDRGTRLHVEGGEVTTVESAGCPEGTTVEVDDLFYNVPARRKYLSQDATEFDHVNTIVTNYALANPDVAVALEHDGREIFATSGHGSLREATMAVYGREVAESMIELGSGDLPDGPLTDVSGLVSHPETNRAGREYLSMFVNGRYVRSKAARNAVVSAYGKQLAADRYPFAVLNLSLPAGTVDVNVHPRKMEVRFVDEAGLREQIETAVESALLREGLLRSSAPRGRSAPEQTTVDPHLSEAPDEGSEPSGQPDEDTRPTTTETAFGEDARPTTPESSPEDGRPSESADWTGGSSGPSDTAPSNDDETVYPETTGERTASASADTRPGGTTDDASVQDSPDDGDDIETQSGSVDRSDDSVTDRETDGKPPTDSRVVDSGQQVTFGEGEALDREFDSLPAMRLLGQFRETYVVAEADTGLIVIDQHAADERINYERLRAEFDGQTTTQTLAEPVELTLTAREVELFDSFQPALSRLGFAAERVDDRTIAVRTVPTLLADTADPELLCDVLASFVDTDTEPGSTVEAAADDLLADLACYPSITGNTSLTEGSIVDLLERLDECENPYACPHGRPVLIEVDDDELADRFERDYPGHGVRRLD